MEDRIDSLAAQLPSGSRVVAPISDPSHRVNSLVHMIDRACLGRCFSYANYEASTTQFRVRAAPGNPYVAAAYGDSWDLQNGQYVVLPGDPPLLCIALDPAGRFTVEELKTGARCEAIFWNVFENRPATP